MSRNKYNSGFGSIIEGLVVQNHNMHITDFGTRNKMANKALSKSTEHYPGLQSRLLAQFNPPEFNAAVKFIIRGSKHAQIEKSKFQN